MGKVYNVSRVINKKGGFELDISKYNSYSEVSHLNSFGNKFEAKQLTKI